jgi:hypothetical protein
MTESSRKYAYSQYERNRSKINKAGEPDFDTLVKINIKIGSRVL